MAYSSTTHLTLDEAAILAASQAVEATAELLLYSREGPHSDTVAFEGEVVCKLAEALKLAIDIEDTGGSDFLDEDEKALIASLQSNLIAFLEGWAG